MWFIYILVRGVQIYLGWGKGEQIQRGDFQFSPEINVIYSLNITVLFLIIKYNMYAVKQQKENQRL